MGTAAEEQTSLSIGTAYTITAYTITAYTRTVKTMQDKALEKISDEMAANSNNTYVQVVGQFLTQHITANPQDAEKVLAEGKTITKSLDAMRKAAEKKKVGSVAVLTDAEGFAIVLKYFGIKTAATVSANTDSSTPSVTNKADFDVSLDDLL